MSDEVAAFAWRAFGYGITARASEDVAPFLVGQGGNGKTTLLEALRAAAGDYARTVEVDLIMRGGRQHEEHRAALRGVRLATIEETAEDGFLAVEALKMLTGGGRIPARHLYKSPFEFAPTHLLVVATNNRPRVTANDNATWRRLRLLPFETRFPRDDEEHQAGDRERDPELRDRLTQGVPQREAVLARLVAEAGAWYRDGLVASSEVTAATTEWRHSEDIIGRFISERVDFAPKGRTRAGSIYDDYTRWCEANGHHYKALEAFSTALVAHPEAVRAKVTRTRDKHTRYFDGLSLRFDPQGPF